MSEYAKCNKCNIQYKTYPVLICNHLECLMFEFHLRDIHYNDDKGLCKSCRNKVLSDPIFMLRGWTYVKLQLELKKLETKDLKELRKIDKVLVRIKKEHDKYENTPEVQEMYFKHNPARFKNYKLNEPCVYCGNHPGDHWINDPNQPEPTIDKCWWVCKGCDELLELQTTHAMMLNARQMMDGKITQKSMEKMDDQLVKKEQEIYQLSLRLGVETRCYEIGKDRYGRYDNKRVY